MHNSVHFSMLLTNVSMILVAFFVYLCTVAEPNHLKSSAVLESVNRQFTSSKLHEKDNKNGVQPQTTNMHDIANKIGMVESQKQVTITIHITPESIEYRAPRGLAFDSSGRIVPETVTLLNRIASACEEFELYLSAITYPDELPRFIQDEHTPINQSLQRASSIHRLLLDRNLGRHQFNSSATVIANPKLNYELSIVLHRATKITAEITS